MRNLWHRLTAPRATDEDEARREYMTKVLLVILGAVALGVTPLFVIGWSIGVLVPYLPVIGISIGAFFVGGWGLAQRGHWRLSSYIPPAGAFLIALYTNYGAGAGSSAMLYYAIAMLLAAMFQGIKAQWGMLGLSLGAYLGIGWAHAHAYLSPGPRPETDFASWVAGVSVAFLIITILQWFSTNQFQRVLAQSRAYAAELAERKAGLEEQVAARMAEVTRLAKADRQARAELERAVAEYGTFTHKVAQGDLRGRLTVTATADLGTLGQHLNDMVAGLRELSAQTVAAAQNITTATSEILAAAEQQVASTQEQAGAVAQTVSTVTGIKAIAEELTERAQGAADVAMQAQVISQRGLQTVDEMILSMKDIQSHVREVAEMVVALSAQAQQICEIISTVDQIAAQSNMLALNAAVEAARAGEAGQGFAVVAEEVRALAERSQAATARVRGILHDIQGATKTLVTAMEVESESVTQGEQLATQAGEVIAELGAQIDVAALTAMHQVSSAQQQVGGLTQVTAAMEQINSATQQMVGSVRQTERAAQDLNALAQQMARLVTQYQVGA